MLVSTEPAVIYTKPVGLLSEVNFRHFASGKMPVAVVENDIHSILPHNEGQSLIAKICSIFMIVNTDNSMDDAKLMLSREVSRTNDTLKPLIKSEDLEGVGDTIKWAIKTQVTL